MKNLCCFVVIASAFICNANCRSDKWFCNSPGGCYRWCPTRKSCDDCGRGCAWCHAKVVSTSTDINLGWCQLSDGRKNCGTGAEYGNLSEILGGDLTSVEVFASSSMCPAPSTEETPLAREYKTCSDCTWAGFQWCQVEKGGKLGGVCLEPAKVTPSLQCNSRLQMDLGASSFTVINRRDLCPATTTTATTTVPRDSRGHCSSRTNCDGPGGCIESPYCHWCNAGIVSSSTDLNVGFCKRYEYRSYTCEPEEYGQLWRPLGSDLATKSSKTDNKCPSVTTADTPFVHAHSTCSTCIEAGFQWCSIEKGGKLGGLCLDTRKTSPALQCDSKFQMDLGASSFTVVNRGGTCPYIGCMTNTSCDACKAAKCRWCYAHAWPTGSISGNDLNLGFCADNSDDIPDDDYDNYSNALAKCGFYNFGTLMEVVGYSDLWTKMLPSKASCPSPYASAYVKAYTTCNHCVGSGYTWCGIGKAGRSGGVCLDPSKIGPDMSCNYLFPVYFGATSYKKVDRYEGSC